MSALPIPAYDRGATLTATLWLLGAFFAVLALCAALAMIEGWRSRR